MFVVCAFAWLVNAAHAEDIDIFGAGRNASVADPNVILIIDNSANWDLPLGGSSKFSAMKTALAAVVNSLTDATGNVNLGLLLFNEPGGPTTAANDGAYVRYAARSMSTAANRAGFVALLNGLDATADRGKAMQPAMALEEVRRYLGGLPILNGGNTSAKLDRQAVGAGQSYAAPVAGDCQKNFIVFLSNGAASADDQSIALPFVSALNGGAQPTMLRLPAPYPAPLLPASQDAAANWMDEYAALLRRAPYPAPPPGLPAGFAVPSTIVTYGIAVHDPANAADNASASASGRALVLNAAIQGGGKYFDATDAGALAQALGAVLAEVQAVDSIFASAALPASTSPLGISLNQVYMGMFRPDASGSPRWVGNLKQYQFAYNSSTGALDLVDARNRSAINAAGGFITPTAQSFWSSAQTSGPILPAGSATVDFFANAPAGTGLTPVQQRQEAPDGEVADKGGVAQQLRASFLGNQSARNVYTCPASGCVAGSALAGSLGYAFDGSNVTCATHQAAFNLNAATCASELPLLIDWIRGADNSSPGNEATPGPGSLGPSPVRGSIHGDVLHSRPLLVNYGTPGIVAFYGANDGTLRAVNAGLSGSGAGRELWSFVAPETFPKFKRLREASPPLQLPSPSSGTATGAAPVSGARPKDYFFDGTPSSHEGRDGAGNVTRRFLFATARRGGSFVYAFDITTPAAPVFLWQHSARDGTDSAFDDLALTFSGAKAALVAGYPSPVVIFGGGYPGGYDPGGAAAGEDADPPAPCAPTPAQGCGNRIYVLDAATGTVVKSFQSNAGAGGDLANGVAADIALVDSQGSGVIDRGYAVDTGGNVWRIDFDRSGVATWKMTKFATAGNTANRRKFLFAPDVVVLKNYTAVLVGSGDREKPLREAGNDRFYMLKDRATGAVVGRGSGPASNWPINADDTGGGNMADVLSLPASQLRDTLAADTNNGWFYSLAPGEKVVNAPLTAAGIVYFGTNRPASAISATPAGSCRANLGIAKAYGLQFNSGTPGRDLNGDGVLDAGDAAVTLSGGGLPPSPVGGLVSVLDSATNTTVVVPFVIGAGGTAGGAAGLPSQSAPAKVSVKLSKARKKTYWYSRTAP